MININFSNKNRDRVKVPVTVADRILEFLALAMVIALLVLTGVLYAKAPDMVPSHFNALGEADAWSSKSFYWVLPVMLLPGMAISAFAAYNPNMINIPIRLKEAVFEQQVGLAMQMCRVMTLGMGVIWLAVLLSMSSEMLGFSSAACACMIGGSMALLLLVALVYTLRIWWIGRNCD